MFGTDTMTKTKLHYLIHGFIHNLTKQKREIHVMRDGGKNKPISYVQSQNKMGTEKISPKRLVSICTDKYL